MSDTKPLNYHSESILVVDDCLDSLKLLSYILSSAGYEVEESDCGEQAIEIAKYILPSIIILDICMPEMDGFEVCQILKEDSQTKDIPVIFISALHEANRKTQAFDFGGRDYITKPFQVEEVLARVRNQLNIRRLHSELKSKNAILEGKIEECRSLANQLFERNQKLNKLDTLDGLTKIPNRAYFDEFFTREWAIAKKQGTSVSLILCDVDYFKLFNDSFGDRVGDDCLQQIARAIVRVVRHSGNLVARYGEEEFVVILPRIAVKDALVIAEDIRLAIKKLKIDRSESSIGELITLSLGVSWVIPRPIHSKTQLLTAADRALDRAKQSRDRTVVKLLDETKSYRNDYLE
jgi:diguanylate cyclase (GGDEF)-like protein